MSGVSYTLAYLGIPMSSIARIGVPLVAVFLLDTPASGSGQQPADMVSMVEAALEEFETPNGPIVEVARYPICPRTAPDRWEPCLDARADSVIVAYAAQVGAALVFSDTPPPPCRWNQVELSHRMGAQLSVRVLGERDGSFWIEARVSCLGDPGPFRLPFHSVQYPFRPVDGAWRRFGAAITVVS